MMLLPGAIGAVSEVLDAGDFYRESHAKTYRAALCSTPRGEPVDAITLVDDFGSAASRGDRRPRKLAELAASCRRRRTRLTTPASCARWRPCAGSSARAPRSRGSAKDRPGETAGPRRPVPSRSFELAPGPGDERLHAHREPAQGELERSSPSSTRRAPTSPAASTGFRELDKAYLGFQPGNLIILAARPRWGSPRSGSAWPRTSRSGTRSRRPLHARDRSPRSRSG